MIIRYVGTGAGTRARVRGARTGRQAPRGSWQGRGKRRAGEGGRRARAISRANGALSSVEGGGLVANRAVVRDGSDGGDRGTAADGTIEPLGEEGGRGHGGGWGREGCGPTGPVEAPRLYGPPAALPHLSDAGKRPGKVIAAACRLEAGGKARQGKERRGAGGRGRSNPGGGCSAAQGARSRCVAGGRRRKIYGTLQGAGGKSGNDEKTRGMREEWGAVGGEGKKGGGEEEGEEEKKRWQWRVVRAVRVRPAPPERRSVQR